jgi:phage FluMu protein Com
MEQLQLKFIWIKAEADGIDCFSLTLNDVKLCRIFKRPGVCAESEGIRFEVSSFMSNQWYVSTSIDLQVIADELEVEVQNWFTKIIYGCVCSFDRSELLTSAIQAPDKLHSIEYKCPHCNEVVHLSSTSSTIYITCPACKNVVGSITILNPDADTTSKK